MPRCQNHSGSCIAKDLNHVQSFMQQLVSVQLSEDGSAWSQMMKGMPDLWPNEGVLQNNITLNLDEMNICRLRLRKLWFVFFFFSSPFYKRLAK